MARDLKAAHIHNTQRNSSLNEHTE
jgi:hypothetical protein